MATIAAPDNTQKMQVALRSTAVVVLVGLVWGAVMLLVFGFWLRSKYDVTAVGQRMVANGLLLAGAAAIGLAIWQGFVLWFKKETPVQKAASLEQQKLVFSYVFMGVGFAMIVLAFYVGMGRKAEGGSFGFLLDNFAESFGTLLFGMIALCGGYFLQRPTGDQGITVQFLVEKVQVLKFSQIVVAAAALGTMAWIVNKNWTGNAYTAYLPELGTLLGLSLLAVMCFLYLNSGTMDEAAVRRFVLLFGGISGFCLFLWSIWRTILWRDDIFLGGSTAWSGENSYRFWLCAYVLFFSLILMFVSFNLGKADVRTDIVLRRVMYGYDALVQAFLLIGILYVFNVVFYAMVPFTFDWTKSRGIYAIGASTKKLVENLKSETNLVVLLSQKSPVSKDLRILLDNCKAINNNLVVQYVSPDDDPEQYAKLSKRFGRILPDEKTPGSAGRGVLIVNGKMPEKEGHSIPYSFVAERKLFKFDREGPEGKAQYTFLAEDEIFKELQFLLQDRSKRKVYILQGNGEPTVGRGAAPRRTDYSDTFKNVSLRFLVEKLKLDNYDVSGLTFELEVGKPKGDDTVFAKEEGPNKRKEVPDDCHTLIIAGVSKSLSNEILEAVERYMSRGGPIGSRLLVFLDVLPQTNYAKFRETGLEPMLKRFNVEVTNDFALRLLASKTDDPGLLLVTMPSNTENVLARQFSEKTVIFTKSARVLKPATGGRFKAETVMELEKSTSYVITESDTKVLADAQSHMLDLQKPQNRVKLDKIINDEPVPVAVAVSEGDEPRMVVFGDTEFITDFEMLRSPSSRENYDFVLSSLEWMSKRDRIGGSPRRDSSYRLPASAITVVTRMILLPGWLMVISLISLGACIWVVRRR